MKLTLDQTLQKGDEAHKAGQIQEADRFYASVLQSQPKHPEANHKMGVLAVGIGNIKEALPFLKMAVETNPSRIQFWLSYINALIRLGKTSDAAAAFNQAKKKGFKGSAFDQIEKIMNELEGSARDTDPEGRGTSKEKSNILDTLTLDQATKLAREKLENGFSEEAKSLYEDILIRFPQNQKATDGIKIIFEERSGAASKNPDPTPEELQPLISIYGQGHLQQALNQTIEMLKLFPKSLTLHNIRGAAHAGLGEFNEAIDSYKQALQINPNDADTYYNMGAALKDKGELDAAIDSYKKALKINPNDADTYYNMGAALKDKGELDAAIGAFKKAFKINPNYADAYYNMGNMLRDKGELDSAIGAYKQTLKIDPNYANAYYNMGVAFADKGELDAAIGAYKQTLKIDSNFADAYDSMAVALTAKGELDAAIESYKQVLKIKPEYAETYYNIGSALRNKGELDAAIGAFKQALKIKPDYPEAHYDIGNALRNKGELDAAIDSFKETLQINPNHVEAYNNMGITLRNKGELDAAIGAYKQTLKIDPNYANAYYNMGVALTEKGELDAAIDSFKETLQIDPNYAAAYDNMGVILSSHIFTKPAPGLQEIITSLLNRKNYVRPSIITNAAISLLKVEPVIKELFEQYHAGGLTQPLQETISVLSELPLLLAFMSVCPLADLELEVFLSDIRFSLLSSISEVSASPKCLLFQSALALQCFTNEYIYNLTDQEAEELEALEISVKNSLLNGKQPHPKLILCLASYKALHNYEWAGLLIMTADIREVFIRQILEPKQEGSLKTEIPILAEVSNKVSCKVRDQYEENPYPRWVDLGLRSKPAAISEIVIERKMRLFDNGIIDATSPNILVAGCGTGQHSIQTATGFQNSKVLAIDLSLASLAYAKRKTDELGIQNIDYMHADILDLGKLDRQFDIIESAGVLHHMDDPMAGWKVLTGCLKHGGLMKIGLYSELARQHIVTVRDEISQSGSGASEAAIKSLRKDLIRSNKEHHITITKILDFYSLSELRDLLFHVQEHRFTIPQIKSGLSRLGLVFCGFDYADRVVQDFKRANTGANDPYDLDKWHWYEEANPFSFINMYQFWCQKVT